MAFAIPRPATAFALDPRTGSKSRKPKQQDKDYLAWLHQWPCVVSGRMPVDAAHIRMSSPVHGKGLTGMGEKPSDRWCLPLHRIEHDRQHSMDERAYWTERGIDPCEVALALHAAFSAGDDEAAQLVLDQARKRVKR